MQRLHAGGSVQGQARFRERQSRAGSSPDSEPVGSATGTFARSVSVGSFLCTPERITPGIWGTTVITVLTVFFLELILELQNIFLVLFRLSHFPEAP